MRRLFLTILFISMSSVSVSFAAKKNPVKKLLFSVLVNNKYSKQKTTVYLEGKDWICSTEIKKVFFAGEKKFNMKLFNQAMDEKTKVERGIECRESLTLIDHEKNKTKRFQCVASEKHIEFLNQLTRYCGR